jgi:SAM-dependent methyltransferase
MIAASPSRVLPGGRGDRLNSDPYVCPEDRNPLSLRGDALFCSACDRSFGRIGGILDLDIVKSAEREHFDGHFRGQQLLSAEEMSASANMAARFLARAGGKLTGKRVLDMACGNGMLTHGLLANPAVTDCEIFCFDHSVQSMRVFLNSAARLHTSNQLHPSIQDVHRLAYRDDYFDVICGNAILHHFLHYEAVLAQVHRSLRKGGTALFAEPFSYGYLWAMFMIKLAGAFAPEGAADLGAYDFITKDTFFRIDNYADKEKLGTLVDKHYFLDDEVVNLCADLGFRVRFAPYEAPGYYASFFITDLLRSYNITNPIVIGGAQALYAKLSGELPKSIQRVVPHFKFILLQKE